MPLSSDAYMLLSFILGCPIGFHPLIQKTLIDSKTICECDKPAVSFKRGIDNSKPLHFCRMAILARRLAILMQCRKQRSKHSGEYVDSVGVMSNQKQHRTCIWEPTSEEHEDISSNEICVSVCFESYCFWIFEGNKIVFFKKGAYYRLDRATSTLAGKVLAASSAASR